MKATQLKYLSILNSTH